MKSIPDFSDKNPYYVVASPYSRSSAGIKVLYHLCHHLNLKGYPAYIVPYHCVQVKYATPIDLLTPILTKAIHEKHIDEGKKPTVIYPETIKGNPLQAKTVVRYLLNYPTLLGGQGSYDKDDIIFSYSQLIAKTSHSDPRNILFIPTSDPKIFHPPPSKTPRNGSCFYAAKYRHFHGGKLHKITENSFEITRYKKDSPTQDEIANILRKSETFYCYEDSALALEATLCGCPAVFIPNEYFSGTPIAQHELKGDGFAFGTESSKIVTARQTVTKAFKNYQDSDKIYEKQLNHFIRHTQQKALEKECYPLNLSILGLWTKIMMSFDILIEYKTKYGIVKLIMKIINFSLKRLCKHKYS